MTDRPADMAEPAFRSRQLADRHPLRPLQQPIENFPLDQRAGGHSGYRTIEQAVEAPVRLATLGPDGPTAGRAPVRDFGISLPLPK